MAPPAYEDLDDLASAIKRARGAAGLSQDELAHEIGTSIGTVKRWETGQEASLGRTPEARRAVAILVAEVTAAPREWFGLADRSGSIDARLATLEAQMTAVRSVLEQGEDEDFHQAMQAADDVAQQFDHSRRRHGDTGSAAAND